MKSTAVKDRPDPVPTFDRAEKDRGLSLLLFALGWACFIVSALFIVGILIDHSTPGRQWTTTLCSLGGGLCFMIRDYVRER